MKKIKGFTLMEMLIVVAVIVILTGIAIPTFRNAKMRSGEDADIQAVSALYTEMQAEYEIYEKADSQTLFGMEEKYNAENSRVGELGGLIKDSGWTKGGSVTIAVDSAGKFSVTCK